MKPKDNTESHPGAEYSDNFGKVKESFGTTPDDIDRGFCEGYNEDQELIDMEDPMHRYDEIFWDEPFGGFLGRGKTWER